LYAGFNLRAKSKPKHFDESAPLFQTAPVDALPCMKVARATTCPPMQMSGCRELGDPVGRTLRRWRFEKRFEKRFDENSLAHVVIRLIEFDESARLRSPTCPAGMVHKRDGDDAAHCRN
jgi:hypothetical protein